MTTATHPFERAGLGKAPFRCVGMYRSLQMQINRFKTAAANTRKDARIAAALTKLEAHRETLAGMVVVVAGHERQALERLEWLFVHARRTGRIKAAKLLDELLDVAERKRAAVNDDIVRHERDGWFSEMP